MPHITNRLLFIGLGDIGINAVFEARRRLARVRAPVGECYLDPERLDRNPHNFLLVRPGEATTENLMAAIHHPSADGWDETLFDLEQELCAPGKLLPALEQSITRLTNLDSAEFQNRTGTGVSVFDPLVVVVVDRKALADSETPGLIETIIAPPTENTKLYMGRNRRYQVALVVTAPRQAACRDLLQALAQQVSALFLIGQDCTAVLDEPDDFVDLAANTCYALAQLPADQGHRFVQENRAGNTYAIGAAHYHFTGAELDEQATRISLADQEYEFEDGFGERFRHLFIGRFETVDLKKPVANDQVRPLAEWLDDDVAPVMQTQIAGRADALAEEEKAWLARSMGNIRENLKRAALCDRVRALTDFDQTLRHAYLESWPNRLDTLDFLMRYEIHNAARENARTALQEYTADWQTRMGKLFDRAGRTTDQEGHFVAEHPGEVVLRLGQIIDETISEDLIPSARVVEYDVQHVPAAPKTRKDVEAAANKVPHVSSVLLRVALFALFVVLLWPGIHDLLAAAWPSGFGVVGPLVTGGVFGAAGAMLILYFMLISRVKKLEYITRSYLEGRREDWEKEIARIEEELVTGFLDACREAVCNAWKPGKRFFQLLTDKKIASPAGIEETYKRPPKVTEIFYLNRMSLFASLQEALKGWVVRAHCGNLAHKTPPVDDGVFVRDAIAFAQGEADYKPLITSDAVQNHMRDMDLWNAFVGSDAEGKYKIDRLCRLFIRERTRQISVVRKNATMWKGLAAWFEANDAHVEAPENNLMVQKARTTFRVPAPPDPQVSILTQLTGHFRGELSPTFECIPDHDGLLYLTVQGPVDIEKIDWI